MTRGIDPRTPVVIGVGQVLDRSGGAPEPIALAATAAELAAADAGGRVSPSGFDTVAAVPIMGWRYPDAAAGVASLLGASPELTMGAVVGGNTPQMLMNALGVRIAAGESDLTLLCGGESFRTWTTIRRRGEKPEWTSQPEDTTPGWTDGGTFDLAHPAEAALGLFNPPNTYAILEHAIRTEAGRSNAAHTAELGRLWSGFSEVASKNPYAWDRTFYTPAEITTIADDNWMVSHPYPLHMVSNPRVDMASAAIVCSAARAEALGVDRDRWVFLHSGADGIDPMLSERPSFTASAAIRHAGRAALDLAGTDIDGVAHLDVYSCFPSAVEIACAELGIDLSRRLTVYGGLGFAGGPWNNPVGHAIASMVGVLREDRGALGLVTANGGNVQKHSFGVYSTEPPANGFATARPQEAIDAEGRVEVVTDHRGPATLEGWTVSHGRERSAERAWASFRTPTGARGWAVTVDPTEMQRLSTEDLGGTTVEIGPDAELRLGVPD